MSLKLIEGNTKALSERGVVNGEETISARGRTHVLPTTDATTTVGGNAVLGYLPIEDGGKYVGSGAGETVLDDSVVDSFTALEDGFLSGKDGTECRPHHLLISTAAANGCEQIVSSLFGTRGTVRKDMRNDGARWRTSHSSLARRRRRRGRCRRMTEYQGRTLTINRNGFLTAGSFPRHERRKTVSIGSGETFLFLFARFHGSVGRRMFERCSCSR